MNIRIICMGRLKESYWREAIGEYSKRIGAYAGFKIIELPEARLSDKPSEREIALALEAEGRQILTYIVSKSALNVAMCIEGVELSSNQLAEKLASAGLGGISEVNFVVGSSFGLSETVKRACSLRLSMSRMTLPHQLARVVLAEQIYRALSINNNGKYHK